jgi:FtsH-binding integral membrane protein
MSIARGRPVAYDILETMELTLNLVWVGVAIAGIVLQWVTLSRAAASSDRPANTRQKIIAMGCALVILFFVISMTDDLHDQAIMFEEKKPSRILSGMASPTVSSSAQVAPFVFLLFVSQACLGLALPAVRRLVEPSKVFSAAAIACDRIDGRAPPSSLA